MSLLLLQGPELQLSSSPDSHNGDCSQVLPDHSRIENAAQRGNQFRERVLYCHGLFLSGGTFLSFTLLEGSVIRKLSSNKPNPLLCSLFHLFFFPSCHFKCQDFLKDDNFSASVITLPSGPACCFQICVFSAVEHSTSCLSSFWK